MLATSVAFSIYKMCRPPPINQSHDFLTVIKEETTEKILTATFSQPEDSF